MNILSVIPYKLVIPFIVGLVIGAITLYKLTPKEDPKTVTIHDTITETKHDVKVVDRVVKEHDGDVITEHITENSDGVINETKDIKVTPVPLKYRLGVLANYDQSSKIWVKGITIEKHFTDKTTYGVIIQEDQVNKVKFGILLGFSF